MTLWTLAKRELLKNIFDCAFLWGCPIELGNSTVCSPSYTKVSEVLYEDSQAHGTKYIGVVHKNAC